MAEDEPKKKKSGFLSKVFKAVVIGGGLMLTGAVLTEFPIFGLFHYNSGGIDLMSKVNPWLQSFFDSSGITDGLHSLADMIPVTETQYGGAGAPTVISTNAAPSPRAVTDALNTLDF